MNRRALLSFLLLVGILVPGTADSAATVVKKGRDGSRYIVTQDADRPFKSGDFLCIYHAGKPIACGDVTQSNATAAALKLTLKKKDSEIAAGDRVVHARRSGSARTPAAASQVRESAERSPPSSMSSWQIGVEGLGAGFLYSIFGSYRFTDMFAANLGGSYTPIASTTSSGSASATIIAFPVSASLLFLGKSHMLELIAGTAITFVSGSGTFFGASFGSSTTSASSMMIIPEFGLGYRYWPWDGGFSFRLTAYGVILPTVSVIDPLTLSTKTTGGLLPSVGLSLGYAF